MPLLLIIGSFLVVSGVALLINWFSALLFLIKALLPLAVIGLGGLLAYFGWEERKDRKSALLDFSSPAEASRYQAEALAYKEKIAQLSDAKDISSDPSALAEVSNPAESKSDAPAVVLEKAPPDQSEATVTVTEPTE
ncbi:MAG: hypothetical protein LBT47_11160 [Deltaproteobacteria bacterium]|jgi:hypothetical protein|nr:hypothetical protein [Deltaproteobacteria bacterium]